MAVYTEFALPTVKSSLNIIIIMSSERPSKIGKTAGSLQDSLLRLSRAATPSLVEIDPGSNNNIATSNAGTR
jgi:hypothetical protein